MKQPHKWAEVIKAWADGAQIQSRWPRAGSNGGPSEWEDVENPLPTWSSLSIEFRVKPERKVIRYRVALHMGGWDGDQADTPHVVAERQEIAAGSSTFVRWLTDWTEVPL